MQKYIKSFSDGAEPQLKDLGGKGLNLVRMAQAGLAVPDGFVIETGAYQSFIRENNLAAKIQSAITGILFHDAPSLEKASETIKRFFADAVMPEAIVQEIFEAYEKLGKLSVAVRSSATAEDLPGMSFAGQHDSYLNVLGHDQLLERIRHCWASLWNARAISYRLRQNVPQESSYLSLAVIVQKLVNGEKSGILFTVNPLNNRRDQMLIDSSWGLGEAVVSGRVTPDQFVIDKQTGRIVEQRIAMKQVQIVRRNQGTAEERVPSELQQQSSLNDDEIAALHQVAQKVEAYYGEPMDIEWAIEAGVAHVVQARPVTTLFPLAEPHEEPHTSGLKIYLSIRTAQGVSGPFTPMGHEILRLFLAAVIRLTVKDPGKDWRGYKIAAGRMFVDITETLRNPHPRPGKEAGLLSGLMGSKEPIAGKVLVSFIKRNKAELTSRRNTVRPTLQTFYFLSVCLVHLAKVLLWPIHTAKHASTLADRQLTRMKSKLKDAKSIEAKLRLIEDVIVSAAEVTFLQTTYAVPGIMSERFAASHLTQWFGSHTMLTPVLHALPNNPTTRMGSRLVEIACELKKQQESPNAQHPLVQDFLREFGHRSNTELDIGVPRWSEDPAYVINLLKAYIDADPEAVRKKLKEDEAAAEKAVQEIIGKVRQQKGPLWGWAIRKELHYIRKLMGLRELPKFDLIRSFALVRYILQEVGTELVARGQIKEANDIFYLKMPDLGSERPLMETVHKNKKTYEKQQEIKAIPYFMANTGECLYGETELNGKDSLQGIPISPGVYVGIARIVRDPRSVELRTGEVLVAYATDPTWTPLFLNAGALIMATGGQLSHGGIVAREYGIPAVSGIENATEKITTGNQIRVNGTSGLVEIISDNQKPYSAR